MAEAVELATAYVSIVPSMQGAEGTISKVLTPEAESAGTSAGKAAGGNFGSSLQAGIAAMGLGTAAVGITKGLYNIGAGFDDMADTIRITTGATGDDLNGLIDVATNVGKTVPVNFEQIGPVVGQLNQRLGLSGDTLQTVASQYLEAGRILGQDVDIQTTSAAFNQFGIEGDNVVGAMDRLFQVSQSTGVGMNDLASAAGQNGAAMQNLGFNFDDTISLVGSLDKAGIDSSQTLSAMGRGLVNLAKQGEEPQEAFRRVTGQIDDLIKSGDTAGAIDLASGIFGTRAANQFVGAVQSGTLNLEDLTGQLTTSSDTILGTASETSDFAEKWQLVKNNAADAIKPLASGVFDTLGSALDKVSPLLTGIGDWLGDNTWAVQLIASIIGGMLVGALVGVTIATWGFTTALLANPITWIILGIVALVAAIIMLWQNWDTVVSWLKSVWGAIVGWLSGIWQSIVSGISSFVSGVVGFFSGLWTTVVNFVSNGVSNVVNFFTGLPGRAMSGISSLLGRIGSFFSGLWSSVTSLVSTGVSNAISFFVGLPGRAMSGISSLLGRIGSFFSGLWSSAVSLVSHGVSNVISFFTGLPGRAMSAIGGLLGRIGSFFSEAWSKASSAVSSGVNNVVDWFRGLPDKALNALGNIGSKLLQAGRNIIQGFLDGITEGFNKVKDFVGGIGSWIADHKGPKQYDLGLLVPAGGWIMTGLATGLARGIPTVEHTLARITSQVQDGVSVSASPSYAAQVGDAAAGAGGIRIEKIVAPDQNPVVSGRIMAREFLRVAAGEV